MIDSVSFRLIALAPVHSANESENDLSQSLIFLTYRWKISDRVLSQTFLGPCCQLMVKWEKLQHVGKCHLATGKSDVFTAIFTKGSHVTSHPSTTQPQVAMGQGGATDLYGSAPNQAAPTTAYPHPSPPPQPKQLYDLLQLPLHFVSSFTYVSISNFLLY
ncbi:hypothetical protein U0070_015346 [Myodes glareolus]|uniref:Uncharacterized protein n=1 Tax=Myodes glareolus TaxID=447135 RepID=A0AAW0K149_MYOGA